MLSKKEQKRLQALIRKYLDGKASPQEAAFVESYYAFFDRLANAETTPETVQQVREDRMLEVLLERISTASSGARSSSVEMPSSADTPSPAITGPSADVPPQRIPFLRRPVFRLAAAAVLLLMVAGIWLLHRDVGTEKQLTAKTAVADALPGGNKATLTLGNGEVIALDSAADGRLAVQGQVTIVKLAGGQVAYRPAGAGDKTGKDDKSVAYNTLATPIGGQYRLTLPDGTLVWLNSASSIHYPTKFTGSERRVTVTGEAYFEISQNRQMPFLVNARNVSVAVLGTHFDIMAYDDEPSVNTTLVQGKVKVLGGGGDAVLKPGQQAVVTGRAGEAGGVGGIAVKAVDTDKEIAWTTGFFEFDRTGLPALMRQLRRWYGIVPVYHSDGGGRLFDGRISRSLKLSEVLDLLKDNGIHFTIDGKKLVVLP